MSRVSSIYDLKSMTTAAVLIIDSEEEQKVGIGRGWHHRPLAEDETHVSASVLRTLGISPNSGEYITLHFDIVSMIQQVVIIKFLN